MNRQVSFFVLVLLGLLTTFCSSEPAKTETPKEEVKTVSTQSSAPVKSDQQTKYDTYSVDFKKLTFSYDGAIRNTSLFDTKEHVKGIETAELVTETAESLNYKQEISPTEHATIKYTFKDNQLKMIAILIKIDNKEDYEALEAEFLDYFTHKYGAPEKIDGREEVWKGFGGHEVDIIDRSKGNEFFLEIDMK